MQIYVAARMCRADRRVRPGPRADSPAAGSRGQLRRSRLLRAARMGRSMAVAAAAPTPRAATSWGAPVTARTALKARSHAGGSATTASGGVGVGVGAAGTAAGTVARHCVGRFAADGSARSIRQRYAVGAAHHQAAKQPRGPAVSHLAAWPLRRGQQPHVSGCRAPAWLLGEPVLHRALQRNRTCDTLGHLHRPPNFQI